MICVTVVVLEAPETIHCTSAQHYSYCEVNNGSEVQSLDVSTEACTTCTSVKHMQYWNCHLKLNEAHCEVDELLLISRI